jgi:hypothetical protein
MATLFDPYVQLVTSAGVPISGAKLYFYQAGTTTDITTYQDSGAGTPHAQPVVADASGIFAPIYVNNSTYKVVFKTAADVTILTVDNISLGATTFADNVFTLQDNADATKQAMFQLSGITAGNTRTITLPDASGTLILSSSTASQTAAGIVEQATNAETQTGTDTDRYITPANLTAKEATVAELRANTADRIITTDIAYSALAEVTLTDAATVAVDMDTGINFVVTLAGNRALGNPTNTEVGKTGRIRVVQDGTGTRTLSYESSWEFAGGSAPTLTTTAAANDMLYYDVISSTRILVTAVLNIS